MVRYKNKRVLTWKKGEETHIDSVSYPQSQFMGSFYHTDRDESKDDEGQSDDLIVHKNCRMTLEWD